MSLASYLQREGERGERERERERGRDLTENASLFVRIRTPQSPLI